MLISLINNVAFLFALAAVGQILTTRFYKDQFTYQILLGILFGGVTLLGMLNPVEYAPGIIFDGRSIILAVAGVVGGWVTAGIAVAMALAYRYELGGVGAPVGMFVIFQSAVLGVLVRYWWEKNQFKPNAIHFLSLGVLVQIIQLAAFTQIPNQAAYPFIQQAWWILIIFYPIATSLLCIIFRDHLEHIQNQKALQEVQSAIAKDRVMLDTLINTLPDLIWLKTTEGVYLKANHRFEEFFGAKESSIINKTDYDFVSKEQADFFRKNDLIAMEKDSPSVNEEEIMFASDGHHEILETTKVPMRDDQGNTIGILGIGHDITLYKQQAEKLDNYNRQLEHEVEERTHDLRIAMETAKKANQEKSRFLANMSHELRTPMHAIQSFTKLSLKRESDEKVHHFLENIDSSTKRLTNLLNDLLDLSKLESGKMELNLKQANMADIISAAVQSLAGLSKEHGINFDLTEVTEVHARIDLNLITQVIINLASNAIKFSPDNSIIRLSLQKNTDSLVFSIEDDGVGIPDEELKDIFNSFVQSSKTITNAGGTGLGLSICKEIIELHKGKIWVESPPDKKDHGSIFYFQIPINPN